MTAPTQPRNGQADSLSRALAEANAPKAPPDPAANRNMAPFDTPEDRKRREAGKLALKAYHGALDKPLKPEPDAPDLNVIINRCGPIVDKGVSFLAGQPLQIELAAPDAEQQVSNATLNPLQQWLKEALGDEDDFMTFLSEVATNGAIFGHAFIKIIPPVNDSQQYPTLRNLDPQTVTVQTEPDDCQIARSYCITYDTADPDAPSVIVTKRQIIERVDPDGDADAGVENDLDDTWRITNYCRRQNGQAAQLMGPGSMQSQPDQGFEMDGEPEVWPHPYPPIVDCPNLPNPNEHWGAPDLTPAIIGMNTALNFVESNINSIGYMHGHPWLWTNSDLNGVKTQPGRVIEINDPQGTLNALTATGDIAGLMSHAASLRADMDEQSRVPAVALGRQEALPKGQISGIAINLLFQPILEKTTLKRRLYGRMIRETCLRMLALGGLIGDDLNDVRVTLQWKPIMPQDDTAMAQTAVALQQIGYSQRTLIERTGGDPNLEVENKTEEQQRQMDAVMKGQGLPPAPPPPSSKPGKQPPSSEPDGDEGQPSQPPKANKPGKPGKPGVNPNHPAAQLARAKVRAAFGKPPVEPGE